MHRPEPITTDRNRPARCLRHHVWMAACGDCRDARPAPSRRPGKTPAAG